MPLDPLGAVSVVLSFPSFFPLPPPTHQQLHDAPCSGKKNPLRLTLTRRCVPSLFPSLPFSPDSTDTSPPPQRLATNNLTKLPGPTSSLDTVKEDRLGQAELFLTFRYQEQVRPLPLLPSLRPTHPSFPTGLRTGAPQTLQDQENLNFPLQHPLLVHLLWRFVRSRLPHYRRLRWPHRKGGSFLDSGPNEGGGETSLLSRMATRSGRRVLSIVTMVVVVVISSDRCIDCEA